MGALDNLKKAILQNPSGGMSTPGMTSEQASAPAQVNTPKPTQTPKPMTGLTNNKPQSPFMRTMADASGITSPTVTPVQQNTVAQVAASTNPATRSRITEPVTKIVKAVDTTATKQALKSQSLPDMFGTLSKRTGANGDLPSSHITARSQVREAGERLSRFYAQNVAPAYQSFKKAEEDYRAGKITLGELNAAQNTYRDLYNVYQPQQEAWMRLSRYDNDTYWNNADLTEAAESLGLYDSAIVEGNLKLTDMQSRFDALKLTFDSAQTAYDAALTRAQTAQKALETAKKAYDGGKSSPAKYQATLKAFQDALAELESNRDALFKAGNSLSELEGQYNAAQMYLETMAGVTKYGADVYKRRYTDAHPDVVWREDVDRWNAEMGLSGDANTTDFIPMIKHIDELKADNAGGQNDNEIAHYYAVLNSGLAYANMTAESAANARQFFNDRVATYERALEAFNDLTDIETFINSGGILPPDEMAAYEARKAQRDELRSRRAEALNWISKIKTREYEMTYDEVIKGLSKDSQDLIEEYIREVADPSEQVREQLIASANGSFGDYQALRTNTPLAAYGTGINLAGALTDTTMNREELTEALRADGLTDEQIKGVLYYVNYEANARRAERISGSMREASSDESHWFVNTLVNNVNQVMLGMGNGLGAIENLAQYAIRPSSKRERIPGENGANPTFRQVSPDPYFYERAPIDYNSFSNLGTIATRAINEGEAELIRKLFVDENTPEAEQLIQQKRAQFWTNAYNLLVSMEQSALIGELGRLGMTSSLWLLSGQAASNTMQDMHEKGYSDDSIILGGIVSGFAEYITEKISLEGVLNRFQSGITTGMSANEMAKALGKNVLLQALSEGSEEVASNLVNTLYDETIGRLLNGGLSQIEMDALALQQQNPSMKWDEAYKSAFGEWVKSVRDDFIGGFASGGLMGGMWYGAGHMAGTKSARKTGQQIINAGNDYALFQAARNVIDTVAAKTAGADASVGTDTAIRAGRLLNYLTGEEYNTYRVVEARLKALNETEGNITPELLRAIVDTATGQHLTPAERAAFSASQFGQQVANELEEYKAEMDRSRANQMDPYLNENTEWAQGAFETDELARAAYLGTNQGDIVTALGANEMELRYRRAQENNPDASVLTPTSKQIADAGVSAEIADKQGKLLDKVFSGQYLSAKEMRSLDFNNSAVRKVFVERTGMTGIPDGNVSESLKRTYVNEAARQSARVVQNQQAIKAGLDALTEVREEQSKERTKAMKNASKKTRNPILRLIEGATGRRFNTEKRQQAAQEEYESRKRDNARNKEIPTEGRTPFQIINQVRVQSGEPKLLGRAAFVQNAESAGMDVSDSVAVDNAYTMYLREAGLTNAEVNAMLEAARMGEQRKAEAKAAEAEKGKANGIQRGNEGRVSESNGRRGTGGVREDSSAQVKNSRDIGVPGGAEEGQLTEVSAEDVQKTPELRNALDYLEQNGIKAENVHFVVSTEDDFIYISKAGRDIPVRGVYDPDTQSVWILANDSSNAHLSPEQIAAHEVFHHYIKTHPGLFEAIVNRLEADGLYDLAVEAAQKYAGGTQAYDTNSIGPYLEEVMADAHADVNTITGADARQFNKLVKELTAQALQSEATAAGQTDEAKASAIEIPDSAKNSHYDNLGRKLTKGMDAYMKDSFMREGLEEFVENGVVPEGPLMVMYQGGRLGYLTFPDGRLTFWSDRPEVSRTYSMGKYSNDISTTHVQEHTKLRQRIAELENEYDAAKTEASWDPTPENTAKFERIRQELLAAHREIEPFSKDIYTPSKDRDPFPKKPRTVDDAIKLIERYGYNNRAAKVVDVNYTSAQVIDNLALPVLRSALTDAKALGKVLYQFSQELESYVEDNYDTDLEGIEGQPPWIEEDGTERGSEEDYLRRLHDTVVETVHTLADVYDAYSGFDFDNHTEDDVYNLLEEVSAIDATDVRKMLEIANGGTPHFLPSDELWDRVGRYRKNETTDWSHMPSITRTVYNTLGKDATDVRGLDAKGLGIVRTFSSDAELMDYAISLYNSIGGRGIYGCYLNITSPLVLDCKGLTYSELEDLPESAFPQKAEVLDWKYGADYDSMFSQIRSRDLASWAKEQTRPDGTPKYNGVILLNVVDTYLGWGAGTIRGDKASTVAITWDANVPKSTANTNPTDDSRITYSAVEKSNQDNFGHELSPAMDEYMANSYMREDLELDKPLVVMFRAASALKEAFSTHQTEFGNQLAFWTSRASVARSYSHSSAYNPNTDAWNRLESLYRQYFANEFQDEDGLLDEIYRIEKEIELDSRDVVALSRDNDAWDRFRYPRHLIKDILATGIGTTYGTPTEYTGNYTEETDPATGETIYVLERKQGRAPERLTYAELVEKTEGRLRYDSAIYAAYLNITRPYVIDANGLDYDELDYLLDEDFPDADKEAISNTPGIPDASTVRHVANWAQMQRYSDGTPKYDGLIVQHVHDSAQFISSDNELEESTIAVTWAPQSAKSIANKNPTDDPRLAYSAVEKSNQDNLGRELSPAMAEYMADSYMREDLELDSPLMTMYRGGTNLGRESFNRANGDIYLAFFTSRADVARTYSESSTRIPWDTTDPDEKQFRRLADNYARAWSSRYFANLTIKNEGETPELLERIENANAKMAELAPELERLRKIHDQKSQDIVSPTKENISQYDHKEGILGSYLRITKPYVLDAHGRQYFELAVLSDEDFPDKQAILDFKSTEDVPQGQFSDLTPRRSAELKTRDVAAWAARQMNEDGTPKYDGVIVKNVVDAMNGWGDQNIKGSPESTVAVVWDSSNIKSVNNTNPTNDPRITYSAVDDTNAAVREALKEFEPSPNRSPELNDLIRRLAFENESITLDEMMTVPEIAAAEANSTRGKRVDKLPEWEADKKAAKSNFLNLGSYNSETEGKGIQKWTGPVDQGKTAVIVLGPPAAGKSTIAVNELSEFFHGRITDKDEYRPFFTGNKNKEDASFVEQPSSELRKEMYKAITDNGENFVWPTVGRGKYEKWLQNELRTLKEKGYTVYLAYVNVDRNNSMARSLVRSFPSDGSKARYTNIAYAEEGAIEPRINYESAKNDTFTDANGNTMPMVDGYVMFDNSVLGRNAILVENTIPGFREETQKGETYGAQQRELRGNGGGPRSTPGVGGQGVRNLSELGRLSVDSVRDGRVLPDSGRGGLSQLGRELQELGLADGPNVSELIRADEAEAETQRKNELLSQAKASAVQTIKKANAVSVSPTETTTNGVNYDHSKSFAEQVDDYRAYYDGKNKNAWHKSGGNEDSLLVGETPQILHDLGFIDLPLTYPADHMARILKIWNELERQRALGVKEEDLELPPSQGWQGDDWDHAFGPEVLKQLPKALKNPIAVIRSEKKPTRTVTVYTELYDYGMPIRAFVEIEGVGQDNGRRVDAYHVRSVHRSEWADQVLNDAIASELRGNVVGVYYMNEDKLLNVPGIDKEKVAQLGGHKHQRLERSEYTGDLFHTITDRKAEVKPKITDNTKTRQFSHWFKGSLKTTDTKEPRVVYHVTNSDQATKKGLGYRVTFSPEAGARAVYGRLTRAIYLPGEFAANADGVLRQLAQADFDQTFKKERFPESTREKIRAELPGVLNSISRIGSAEKANEELLRYLKKYGIDGIRFKGGEFLLFDPNQIKAVDNIGLYSTNSDNIRYSAVEAKAEKKRKAKLKAAENAKIDKEWAVGLAQSDGEQRLKAAQRFWQDKFNYATRTDIEWAKGMKESERRAGKAETKRRTREAIALDRAIRSLPATAAAKNRRAVRRADTVEINDDQAVLTPLPLPDDTAVKLPRSATEFGNLFKKGFDKFYRAMVNAVQEVDRFAKLQTRTDNMSVWVNIVRSARSTVERFYTDAMLDQQGNAIGPSMEKTFLCFDENGKFDQQLQNALNDYMFHMHNIDRMSLKSRAIDRVKAFEAKYPWLAELSDKDFQKLVANRVPLAVEYAQLLKEAAETEDKPVLADADGNPVTAETSRKVVEVYENDMPWLKDKAQEIYDWWDVFMREWAVGTSITEEQYEHMREIYPHYVPTYRVDKGQHAGYISHTQTALSSGEMVKRATGSLKPLQAMEDQFVKSMTQIVTNNRKNGFLRNLVEELLFDDEGKFSQYGVFDWRSADPALKQSLWEFADETEETAVEKVKVDGQEAYRVSCWVDGVKMSAYVNRAMFEGIKFLFGIHSDAYNKAANLGRKITQPMKNMITGYNPTFAIKNIIRDQHTALTNSHAGIAYWKYLGQAAAKIAENDSDWVNFQALGGVSANETRVDGGFAQAMHPATGVKKAWQTGREWLGKPGEISESMSRFAEYLAMLDILGGDSIENRMAAIRASAEVTVDFGRSGSLGRLINMWVPYWNANVQGLDKAIRNIAEQPDIKSMLRRTSRAVLVNLIPAALQAALIGALGRWKEYEELNDQQKDNYYCIPVSEHKFLKIPKSQDWAAFISTPFLRLWEGVEGRDDPMEGWFESAVLPNMPFDMRDIGLGVEMPVLMPIFLDDLFDLASNKNWAGSAIIPYNLQKASPREQFDADTSLLAYYFGQMFNASPMAIDYLIDNYMGNFWGIAAKTVPLTPLVSRGIVSGETKFSDRAIDAVTTVSSPFLSDNRYSNSALSNYYDMLNTLEQEVVDAGVHGDKTEAEHYHIYQALTQAGGYVDQIRTLTAEAKTLPKGEAQANLRWEAAGLADLALEFVQKCVDGEIEDPELWMTYAPYGENILREAESLRELESSNGGSFNFSGKLGNPGILYDRSGDTDIKYDLTSIEGAQQEYKRLRAEEYQNAINKVINDRSYKTLSPEEKAARLEQARSAALKSADKKMLEHLRYNNVKGETVGKKDYGAEKRAAAYSVSWLLGDSSAYKPELTEQFLDLYDYKDQYSFIPADSTKKTFKDPGDSSKVYVLNSAQQDRYSSIYHDTVTEFYSEVIGSSEYQSASPELRAAMLAKAKTYVNDEIKERFAEYLRKAGIEPTTVEKASSEISLEAKYAVQRMLGDSHAMLKNVTDELVRLYQYSDVGEVEYFPITTAPKSYVDDQHDGQMWVFTPEQREVYMSLMFDIYQRNVQKVMASSAYKNANDYKKAQLLCDVRSRLSGETQAEFKNWLRKTGVPTVSRTSAEAQAVAADVAEAGRIVDGILGTYRTYKQFSEGRGYTQPKKKKK